MIINKEDFVAICKHRDKYESVLEELIKCHDAVFQPADGISLSSPDPDSFSYPVVIFLSKEVENYGEDGVFTYHKPVLVSLDEILTKMEGK